MSAAAARRSVLSVATAASNSRSRLPTRLVSTSDFRTQLGQRRSVATQRHLHQREVLPSVPAGTIPSVSTSSIIINSQSITETQRESPPVSENNRNPWRRLTSALSKQAWLREPTVDEWVQIMRLATLESGSEDSILALLRSMGIIHKTAKSSLFAFQPLSRKQHSSDIQYHQTMVALAVIAHEWQRLLTGRTQPDLVRHSIGSPYDVTSNDDRPPIPMREINREVALSSALAHSTSARRLLSKLALQVGDGPAALLYNLLDVQSFESSTERMRECIELCHRQIASSSLSTQTAWLQCFSKLDTLQQRISASQQQFTSPLLQLIHHLSAKGSVVRQDLQTSARLQAILNNSSGSGSGSGSPTSLVHRRELTARILKVFFDQRDINAFDSLLGRLSSRSQQHQTVEARHLNIAARVTICNALCLQSRIEDAIVFIRLLEQDSPCPDTGITTNSAMWGAVINSLVKHGRRNEAITIFNSLLRPDTPQHMQPTVHILQSMVKSHTLSGNLKSAVKTIHKAIHQRQLRDEQLHLLDERLITTLQLAFFRKLNTVEDVMREFVRPMNRFASNERDSHLLNSTPIRPISAAVHQLVKRIKAPRPAWHLLEPFLTKQHTSATTTTTTTTTTSAQALASTPTSATDMMRVTTANILDSLGIFIEFYAHRGQLLRAMRVLDISDRECMAAASQPDQRYHPLAVIRHYEMIAQQALRFGDLILIRQLMKRLDDRGTIPSEKMQEYLNSSMRYYEFKG